MSALIDVAVFDTKPYDRDYLVHAADAEFISWHFHDFRLTAKTAAAATGARAACLFVNDQAGRATLSILAESGISLIALRSAGYNNVDLEAARSLGLTVVRVPAYSPHAVAEHAVALLLTLNRKVHRAYNRVRELNFSLSGLVGFDLHGKTVGIIGTGKIGRVVAQILRGFGMRVLAHDVKPDAAWAAAHGVQYEALDVVFSTSEVISLHVPLVPDTKYLLDTRTLAQMKPGVFIVNTSRGKLIHTEALIVALKAGHVGGVALDVYEEEEGIFFEDLSGQVLQDDELSLLLNFPNVLITAHQAFLTHEALGEIAAVTTANLRRFQAGEPMLPGTTL
jgi:D-lactate dehydrogenase